MGLAQRVDKQVQIDIEKAQKIGKTFHIEEIDMAKQKERSEVEHLRSTIKNQRSQIKNLKKEVERARKRSFQSDDLEERLAENMIEEEFEENEEISKTERCPECNNTIEIVEMGTRVGIFCECGYRRTKKV